MGILNSSPSYLGIDIGASGIKLVELKKDNNRVVLSTYGFSEIKDDGYINVNQLDVNKIGTLINKISQQAQISSRMCVSSLPTFSVFSSIINFSSYLSDKDLESAIAWEAKKVIPIPLEDIVLDWQKIENQDQSSLASKKISSKVLLTGAPKNLIKNYVDTFKSINYGLLSLETEIFGLVRSLLGNDKATVMIIQMGSNTTNIFIVDHGVPVLSRSIDVGGTAVTKAISSNLNLDLAQAEQFKLDLINNPENVDNLPKVIIDAISPIINEAKYIVEVYSNKEAKKLEKIILTGGSSMLAGLPNYLANILNINVIIGDPWFRVAYPIELKPVLEQIGPKMAVAIGLAMREFDKKI